MVRRILLTLTWVAEVARLSSGSSEHRCREPKQRLDFDDMVHCRDIASLNAFIQHYLSEQGLIGARRGLKSVRESNHFCLF